MQEYWNYAHKHLDQINEHLCVLMRDLDKKAPQRTRFAKEILSRLTSLDSLFSRVHQNFKDKQPTSSEQWQEVHDRARKFGTLLSDFELNFGSNSVASTLIRGAGDQLNKFNRAVHRLSR